MLEKGVIFENTTFLKANLKRGPHSSEDWFYQNV